MQKVITNCALSGTGITLAIKHIKETKSKVVIIINLLSIAIYITSSVITIGRFINQRKTKKAIDNFKI